MSTEIQRNGRITATRFGGEFVLRIEVERPTPGGEPGEYDDVEVLALRVEGSDIGDLFFGSGWTRCEAVGPLTQAEQFNETAVRA